MDLKMNKKGQIENYLSVVIFLFVTSISFIISMIIILNFVNQFTATGYCSDSACIKASMGFLSGIRMWDNIIIIVVVLLIISVGLTCYRLPASTAFFIVSLVAAPFLGYVSYFFNYVFKEMISNVAFDAVRMYYPKTIIICTNFHWIALICFVVGSITLYAKRQQPGGVIE